MANYLLDTNILIDLSGPKKSALFFDNLLREHDLNLTTTVLSITEYMAGAHKKEEKFLKQWVESGEIEIFYLDSLKAAYQAAELRKQHALTLPDAIILAIAVEHKAHLLTHDEVFLKKAKNFIHASDPMV